MKKTIITVLITLAVVGLVIGGWFLLKPKEDSKNNNISTAQTENNAGGSNTNAMANNTTKTDNKTTENTTNTTNNNSTGNNTKKSNLSNEEMYGTILNNYRNAMKEYDINDTDSQIKVGNKYELISMTLVMHVARYKNNGVKLTYSFYDIDKNGVNELIVAADGSAGALYTYDTKNNKVEKLYYLDTLERGSLSIYDNGVIFAQGAGGAAIHYFEFGKIVNGTTYEMIEGVKEEYKDENSNPEYSDVKSERKLDYKSLDEIKSKYIGNAGPIKASDADL